MPMLQPLRRQAHGCSTMSAKLHCHVVWQPGASERLVSCRWYHAEASRQCHLNDRTNSYMHRSHQSVSLVALT
jgi:hypothetical protein